MEIRENSIFDRIDLFDWFQSFDIPNVDIEFCIVKWKIIGQLIFRLKEYTLPWANRNFYEIFV